MIKEFATHIEASDDVIWYYYIGTGVLDKAAFAAEHQFLPTLKAIADSEHTWLRAYFRAAYAGNYLLSSAIYAHAGNFIAGFVIGHEPFPEFLSNAIFFGYFAALIFGFIIAVAAFVAANAEMQRVLVISTAALAAVAALPIDAPTTILSSPPIGLRDVAAIPYRIFKLFVDPNFSMSPFGAMARNQIIFLTMGVFALRWSGKYVCSYVLVVVMLLLHQSMAFLFLAMLVLVDAVMRPALFKSYSFTGIVVSALGLALMREANWAALGEAARKIGDYLPLVVAIALAAVLAFRVRRASVVQRVLPSLDATRRWLTAKGDIFVDVLGITLIFAFLLPVAIAGNEIADFISRQHFWSLLPGRLLALLRPMYFMALCYILLSYLDNRSTSIAVRTAVSSCAVAAFVIFIAIQIGTTPSFTQARARVAGGVAAIDRTLTQRSSTFTGSDESTFYYALLKSRVTHEAYVTAIWRKPD